jgi:hypothetical protein
MLRRAQALGVLIATAGFLQFLPPRRAPDPLPGRTISSQSRPRIGITITPPTCSNAPALAERPMRSRRSQN